MNLSCAAGSIKVVIRAKYFVALVDAKSLRIDVTRSGWYQNALPLFQNFYWLNLLNLHEFKTAKFIHDQIHQQR